jgi:ATP phosphoribosyltransferase
VNSRTTSPTDSPIEARRTTRAAAAPPAASALRLALPKGRMQAGVERLLSAAGLELVGNERDYRPRLAGHDTKRLKPRAIVQMLASGSRDVGFCGLDWVRDEGADLVELVDTGLDPVRVAIAAPAALAERLARGERPEGLRLASEFERLPREWATARGLDVRFVRSFGATEVLPPEDADVICDVVQTGNTLRANGLELVETLIESSTRLFASPAALGDPDKRTRIDELVLLVSSVLAARERVVLELNVAPADFDRVVALVPCMRRPTVAPLADGAGFAIKAAVPRRDLARIVPALKAAGGRDLLVSSLEQIVP